MLVKEVVTNREADPLETELGLTDDSPNGEMGERLELAIAIPQTSPVPRIYYGWVMLGLAMLLAIASSPGQTFGVSIFIEPMRLELGLTHGQMGLAYALGTILGAGPILWIGHLVDRRGLRSIAIGVVIAFGISCIFMAVVQNWFQVVIAFTLLRMLGPGALSLISSNTLPFWFTRRLGTVEGYRQTAMAIAMATIPPFNLWLVYQFGWRIGYAMLGAGIAGVLSFFLWRWFRSGPHEFGQLADGVVPNTDSGVEASSIVDEAVAPLVSRQTRQPSSMTVRETTRTPTFWIVLAGTSLFGMIQTGVFFCLTPIIEEMQLGEGITAAVLASFAVSLAVHQVIGGRLADRLDAKWLLASGMLVFTFGLSCLSTSQTSFSVVLAGIGMGAAQGLYFAAAQPLWARYYGTKHLGKLRGVLMAANVATSSLGPFLVGSCFDYLGSFSPILLLFSFMPLLFSILSFRVRPPNC